MDGKTFDELAKATTGVTSRRGAVGLIAGAALAAGLTRFDFGLAEAKKKKNTKKKRCKKLNQGCGGKKKCCKGLACTAGICSCPTGDVPSGSTCVPAPPPPPPPPGGCQGNGDCHSGQICQNGSCVPEPECLNDDDCGDNEACQGGVCNCPEIEDGRCIRRCDNGGDCPGFPSCRNLSPETSSTFVNGVCVNEPFLLCDVAACTVNQNCASNEVCVMLSCEGSTPVGRCHPFSVF